MYCATCGTQAPNLGARCGKCGSPLAGPAAAPGGPPGLPGLPDPYGRPPLPVGGALVTPFVSPYAGFWLRLVAWVIDLVVMLLLTGGVYLIAELAGAPGSASGGTVALVTWGALVAACVVMEASPLQATPGKLALQLKITDLDGHRLGIGRTLARVVGKVVFVLTLGIGYVLAGATARRQALHDKLAGALVVRRSATPERLAEFPVAPHVSPWLPIVGTVVVLVPIVGMVAAIAIPAYQDYTSRSQVAEGLRLAGETKALVAESYAERRAWPADLQALSGSPKKATTGRYVESVVLDGGAIILTFGGEANAVIAGDRLGLVPAVLPGGDVVWICGYGSIPEGAALAHEDPAGFTSIDSRFLPSKCRD